MPNRNRNKNRIIQRRNGIRNIQVPGEEALLDLLLEINPAAEPLWWEQPQPEVAPMFPVNPVEDDVDAIDQFLAEMDMADQQAPILEMNADIPVNVIQAEDAVDDALVEQSLLTDLFDYFETIVPSSTTVASSLHAVADFINPVHWLHKAHHHAQAEIVEQELPLDQEAIDELLSDPQMDEIQPAGPGI